MSNLGLQSGSKGKHSFLVLSSRFLFIIDQGIFFRV